MQTSLELRRAIRACTNCSLHTLASGPVPPTFPERAREPRIIVIGEAPGRQEDRSLRPFVGPSGTWIRRTLAEAQVDPETVAWANVVCCFPRRDPVTPTGEEVEACRPNLLATLVHARADYALVLGGVALSAFKSNARVSEHRGTWWREGGTLYMSTYHPSYCLRNSNASKVARGDVLEFAFYALGVFDPLVEDREEVKQRVKW